MKTTDGRSVYLGVLGGLICAGGAFAQEWEAVAPLPTGGQPRQYAAGVNDNGVLYAIGGTPWQNGGDRDGAAHRYQNGVWSAVSPVAGAGPIISGAAGMDPLGRMVLYGGFILDDDGTGPDRVYDPVEGLGDRIAERPVPESAIGYFAWASDGQNRLYGFGGGPGEGGPNSDYADRYDALTDSWTVLAPMPTPASDACAAYDGRGHMLVIGGIDQAGAARLANVARYDIAADTWSDTFVPDFPVPISGARAVLGADGRVYVVGGETGPLGAGTARSAVHKLEPDTNEWISVASLATPRKWFACTLGSDDFIYAIGGDNDDGGTDTVERLSTPRCPEITGPDDHIAYAGSVAGFMVSVYGAAPFDFQWRKDGDVLEDGPTGTGSVIAGAATASLTIIQPGDADVGDYDVVVSNDCGDVESAPAVLTLRTPPTVPSSWTVTNLHPAWADGGSNAYGIAEGRVGGSAVIITELPDGRELALAHPILWSADTRTPVDITPPGSGGGVILDMEGNLCVGWFWHLYSCPPWTCGWQSAGFWYADTRQFTETHMSGAEYDHAIATDGARLVSNAAHEIQEGVYYFRPYLWTPPHSVTYLWPGESVDAATVSAIDGGHQFGSIDPAGGTNDRHAAMWSGSGQRVIDVHPAGYTDSYIVGAGDGQAVGRVEVGGQLRAALWAGGTASTVELHQDGWPTSDAVATHGGVQVGTIQGRATLWIGSPDSYVDLHAFAPAGFSSTTAQDVEVDAEGRITVVGYGHNTANEQFEALIWEGELSPGCTRDPAWQCDGDVDGDGQVNPVDSGLVQAAFGSADDQDLCNYDVDCDGQINPVDSGIVQSLFGTCDPPRETCP